VFLFFFLNSVLGGMYTGIGSDFYTLKPPNGYTSIESFIVAVDTITLNLVAGGKLN